MTVPEVTVVIPVFNDRIALETTIPRSLEALSSITDAFEIIVAEDGSTDGSADFVVSWERKDSRVRLLHGGKRLGRGKALTNAISDARANIVCYYDVDLATDMLHLPDLVNAIKEGYDVATGSRLLAESDIVRTEGREIASRTYNFLVRLVLRSRVYDHQCGFKAFNRERILPILPVIRSTHWFWDTEILVRAQRAGYRVREFPVRWRAGSWTTVKIKDIFEMGSAIFRLWWQINVSKT
jgi:glycosyltransferase involved in cell wall biosynthesis